MSNNFMGYSFEKNSTEKRKWNRRRLDFRLIRKWWFNHNLSKYTLLISEVVSDKRTFLQNFMSLSFCYFMRSLFVTLSKICEILLIRLQNLPFWQNKWSRSFKLITKFISLSFCYLCVLICNPFESLWNTHYLNAKFAILAK